MTRIQVADLPKRQRLTVVTDARVDRIEQVRHVVTRIDPLEHPPCDPTPDAADHRHVAGPVLPPAARELVGPVAGLLTEQLGEVHVVGTQEVQAEHVCLQRDSIGVVRLGQQHEEALRVESPVKADFRLALKPTEVGGVPIAPGTPVMLLNGAANRDHRRFECPHEFRIDRENAQSHLAFGRGHHSCPGGPLARAEARISVEKILDRMRDIRLSEEHHGPSGDRHFSYEPTWVLRGLTSLHIEFDAVAA